jgi:glutamine amidotransferase
MKLVIIKYNAGNVRSVQFALERLGIDPVLSDDPSVILSADKILFPGVGEASSAMDYLKQRGLDKVILDAKQPFLGICLGMQLMCSHSEENDTPCLGIFQENVKRFVADQPNVKIPQIGWNTIHGLKTPLFKDVEENSHCYFVHSYYASLGQHTIAQTDYCGVFSAALHTRNYYGVQFHPEKSAEVGSIIIKNFLNIN